MRDTFPPSWLLIKPIPWWLFILVSTALVAVDFATGPYFQFPSVYILFVTLAAWFNGAGAGVLMAVLLPFTRVVLMEFYWAEPWDPMAFIATALTRAVAWSLLAMMTARLAHHERQLRSQVNALISLLPVCTDCHRIRNADEGWESLDTYAGRRGDHFSVALCPVCARIRLPEHVPPS